MNAPDSSRTSTRPPSRKGLVDSAVVYHYTSIETLMKIVESRQIRATCVAYLNDTRERDLLLDAVKERLPQFLKENRSLDRSLFRLFMIPESKLETLTDALPFVASFCREPDSLPQWRAYCANGNGVSIGFRVSCLRKAEVGFDPSLVDKGETIESIAQRPQFGAVEYLGIFSHDKIDRELKAAYDEEQRQLEKQPQTNKVTGRRIVPLPRGYYITRVLEDRAALYKNETFKSENEYRLVVPPVWKRTGVVHFRCNRSTLIPYVNLRIPHWSGEFERQYEDGSSTKTGWDAIEEVWVGPTPDKNLTRRSLDDYFSSLKMPVRVRVTRNSYRDW